MYGTFRDYSKNQVKHFTKIEQFYKDCHTYQTVDFVKSKIAEYGKLNKRVPSSERRFPSGRFADHSISSGHDHLGGF